MYGAKSFYSNGAHHYIGAIARSFGEGSGPIFLDDVRCSGFEARLFDCPYSGIEVSSCTHSKDAGVVCSEGTGNVLAA